jgi:hypothetical protein
LEDAAYAVLGEYAPPPLVQLAPERTLYIAWRWGPWAKMRCVRRC